MDWLGKLKEYAPSIASAIATGGATLPQLAYKAIADATGLDIKSKGDAEKAINSATPDQLLAITKEDNNFKVRMKELETDMLATINKTIQEEGKSEDKFVRRWRPFFGYCVSISWLLQMFGITVVFCWTAIANPADLTSLVSQLATLAGSLSALWGLALAVLGLNVHQRSKDKCTIAAANKAGDK